MVTSHVRAEQRYAWLGPSLLVTTMRGEAGPSEPLSGYWFREARHVSRLRLLVNGEVPWLCAEGHEDPEERLLILTHPEVTTFGGGGTDASDDTVERDPEGLPQRAIDIRMRQRVALSGLEISLAIANRSSEVLDFGLTWEVGADFADIQEALGGKRQQAAEVVQNADGAWLGFHYRHPKLDLGTIVQATGDIEWRAGDGRLDARVRLAARECRTAALLVTPMDAANETSLASKRDRLDCLRRWRERLTRLETPGTSAAARTITRAIADLGSLASLHGAPDEWMAVHAGMPLYPALFGRDTITSGWQAAMFDQGEIVASSLALLGRLQGTREDASTDEQPGRLPFQMRAGPVSRLGLNPFSRSYADFATPLLFIIGLAHRYAWRGDREELRRHWDTARRVLDWAFQYGDRDGDGYLEYQTASPKNPKNQGWKDSGRAIVDEDGASVQPPIATCDLQGYWFAAQQLMSVMAFALGHRDDGRDYWRSAMSLKKRFSEDWWVEEDGFYALALDPKKRRVRSATSNVGQCLATGIIDDAHLPRVVGRLFAPDLFSGWGIRTLADGHPAYSPLSYHCGSVWTVENATIAFGLRRFGFDRRALELTEAIFDLSGLYENGRIPECVGGFARGEMPDPGAYPRANPVQAWNLSAFGMLLQGLLGLQPLAPLHTLVVDPKLPPWLPDITLRNLRLGNAHATIRFVRGSRGHSHAELVSRRGPFHLVHQPPVESLTAGPADRFRALFDSALHH